MLSFYYYAQYWKRKAAYALLQYGRNAQNHEERKWAAQQALMAGHKDAAKLYALTCPEAFDKELPLVPFIEITLNAFLPITTIPKGTIISSTKINGNLQIQSICSKKAKMNVANILHKHLKPYAQPVI